VTTRIALLALSVAAAGAAALTLTLASPATVRSRVPWATLAFSKSEVAGGGVYIAGRGRARLVLPAATDPAWSPDGRRLAYLAPGAGGAADVFVADAGGTNRGRLTATDLDETSPTWAPDGRRLAVERNGSIVCCGPTGSRAGRWRKVQSRPGRREDSASRSRPAVTSSSSEPGAGARST